jgi:hypothetical protein
MIVVAYILLTLGCQGLVTALQTCNQFNLDRCMGPFQTHFSNGIDALKNANDTVHMEVCWKYEIVSSCLIPLMYYCPDIKQNLKSQMEDFEFFCTAHRSGGGRGGMPLKPTFDPNQTDELINEANEKKEQKKKPLIVPLKQASQLQSLLCSFLFVLWRIAFRD